jgi:flavorubredoxin
MKAFADNQETAFYMGTPTINGTAVTNTGTGADNIINQFSTAQQVFLVGVSSGGVETAITSL